MLDVGCSCWRLPVQDTDRISIPGTRLAEERRLTHLLLSWHLSSTSTWPWIRVGSMGGLDWLAGCTASIHPLPMQAGEARETRTDRSGALRSWWVNSLGGEERAVMLTQALSWLHWMSSVCNSRGEGDLDDTPRTAHILLHELWQ